ncbi:hypothetical protein [Actinoplanes sp. NPDC026623]|uniref:hypothetical protein n=1 Tax=Actinoplanes sp. NPDC026623 TaxID=3155610 RepID=UPI0033D2205D
MRILLMILAVAGAVTAGVGVTFSIKTAILVGAALLVIATVMSALAGPWIRRGR